MKLLQLISSENSAINYLYFSHKGNNILANDL